MSTKRKKLLTAIALTLIIALGAFLRLYQLGAYSIGNTYYAATVKSMLTSPSNFFFGSFEPGGSVTVDKPPLGFWVQAISAGLFGVSGFSLALPNALAGIGSIGLIYYLLKEQVSRGAGLVAALTLAVIPVTISTERNNTIDGLLVFVLLLATWAVLKSVQSGKFRYLLLGAFIVGLGFNIKMLQAYMVIPALYALYFFGAKQGWWTKIWHLGISTLLLFAVSLSWAIAVDLVPEENRPFIGSSEDNTVLELIIGHNGLSRLGLNDNSKKNRDGGTQPQPPADDGQHAQASTVSNQSPNQTPVNVGAAPNQVPEEALNACQNLAVGDACTVELPRRDIEGTCQTFQQTDDLVCSPNNRPAPIDGQVAGNPPVDGQPTGGRPNGGGAFNTSETGQAGIDRLFSEPLVTEASWILPLALFSILLTSVTLVMTSRTKQSPAANAEIATLQVHAPRKDKWLSLTLWSLWLLPIMAYFSFTTGLFHRYYLIMLGPALAALTGLAFWSVSQLFKRNRWTGFGAILLLMITTLGFQASMLSEYDTASWALPLAIAGSLIGLAILLIANGAKKSPALLNNAALAIILLSMLIAPFTWAAMVTMSDTANVALPTATLNDSQPTTFMTPDNTVMSENEVAIMDYLLANTDPNGYLLATVNARSAAPYILETGRPVLTFGGFSGGDQVIDAEGVAEMVSSGELRYILYSDKINNSHRDIAAWVMASCVPTEVPGVEVRAQKTAQGQNTQNARMGPPSENEVLYDCVQ
ncbi:MAG: glycosyltransferase family 39 protein [Anaerolineae bacterium]|nr:glycosyltransferase family 39 protein [Anaerolineae bacterium]MBT7075592.1 glycosyltransferase family 39 protein [Anaerolineae bacterium]MBT7783172.1 glycosyltransferase family 39 protein [Anaerolineae bacterium]